MKKIKGPLLPLPFQEIILTLKVLKVRFCSEFLRSNVVLRGVFSIDKAPITQSLIGINYEKDLINRG